MFDYDSVEDELTTELEEEKENGNNVLDITSNIDGDDDILYENIW